MRLTGRFLVRPLLALTMAVAAVVVPLSPAQAEGNITCAYEDSIVTTPGLRNTPTRYTFESETKAKITCFGTLGDDVVAGTGWFVEKGTGYGTCLEAVGSIDIAGEMPTADGGTIKVTGHVWAVRAGTTGIATGFINGVLVTGPYAAQPSGAPNCAEGAPVARGTVVRGVAATIPPQDVVAPPSPQDFEGEQRDAGVHLSWAPGEGDPVLPVVGYRVYRDGQDIATVPAGASSYIDSLVEPGWHTYSLAAFNGAGVESELAGPVAINVVEGQPWTPQTFDPMTSPTQVRAKTSPTLRSDVALKWREPRLASPEFYRIYSTRDAFHPIGTVTRRSYVDPEVDFSCAYSYTYYVTAVDADGTEAWSEPLEVGPFTEPGYACP